MGGSCLIIEANKIVLKTKYIIHVYNITIFSIHCRLRKNNHTKVRNFQGNYDMYDVNKNVCSLFKINLIKKRSICNISIYLPCLYR